MPPNGTPADRALNIVGARGTPDNVAVVPGYCMLSRSSLVGSDRRLGKLAARIGKVPGTGLLQRLRSYSTQFDTTDLRAS